MDKQLKDVAKSLNSTSDGIVLKECILALARDSSILKKAYLGLVAKSVMTLTVYEEYLLNETDSQNLAKAMSDLKNALHSQRDIPYRNYKNERNHAKFVRTYGRRNTGTRIASKRFPKEKGGRPPTGVDAG